MLFKKKMLIYISIYIYFNSELFYLNGDNSDCSVALRKDNKTENHRSSRICCRSRCTERMMFIANDLLLFVFNYVF